jgi:hypothetical protein
MYIIFGAAGWGVVVMIDVVIVTFICYMKSKIV